MVFLALLVLHVAGGGVALLAGPVAIGARKGSRVHRRAGRTYAIAMLVASLAAIPLSILRHNVLLLVIAVLTLYLVQTGFAAIRRRGRKRASRPSDAIPAATCILFSAGLLLYSLPHGAQPVFVTGLFFGAAGILLATRTLRALANPATNWLQQHITGMMGAYIATVTAFLVVNLTFLPQALVFIGPTLIGTPLIAWMSVRHLGPRKAAASIA